jgi:hypothetical protein
MFRTYLDSLARHLAHFGPVLRFAAAVSALYVLWFVAFERWLDPLLRRCGGLILGHRIVWVRAGPFRTWGLLEAGFPGIEKSAGFFGAVAVLSASFVPFIAIHAVAQLMSADPLTAAVGYLMSVPMMALFVLRVLSKNDASRESAARPSTR